MTKVIFFFIVLTQGNAPVERTQAMANMAACYEFMGEAAAELKLDPKFKGVVLMGCQIAQDPGVSS